PGVPGRKSARYGKLPPCRALIGREREAVINSWHRREGSCPVAPIWQGTAAKASRAADDHACSALSRNKRSVGLLRQNGRASAEGSPGQIFIMVLRSARVSLL